MAAMERKSTLRQVYYGRLAAVHNIMQALGGRLELKAAWAHPAEMLLDF